jgi:hypothetical protein
MTPPDPVATSIYNQLRLIAFPDVRKAHNARASKWKKENREKANEACRNRWHNGTARNGALLRAYGITQDEYDKALLLQNGVCKICGAQPKTRRLAVDHEHVPNYKKMPPEEKRKYIRGIICFHCNFTMLHRSLTLAKAKSVVKYLEEYEQRKATYP